MMDDAKAKIDNAILAAMMIISMCSRKMVMIEV